MRHRRQLTRARFRLRFSLLRFTPRFSALPRQGGRQGAAVHAWRRGWGVGRPAVRPAGRRARPQAASPRPRRPAPLLTAHLLQRGAQQPTEGGRTAHPARTVSADAVPPLRTTRWRCATCLYDRFLTVHGNNFAVSHNLFSHAGIIYEQNTGQNNFCFKYFYFKINRIVTLDSSF